jgi:hypothetical protein
MKSVYNRMPGDGVPYVTAMKGDLFRDLYVVIYHCAFTGGEIWDMWLGFKAKFSSPIVKIMEFSGHGSNDGLQVLFGGVQVTYDSIIKQFLPHVESGILLSCCRSAIGIRTWMSNHDLPPGKFLAGFDGDIRWASSVFEIGLFVCRLFAGRSDFGAIGEDNTEKMIVFRLSTLYFCPLLLPVQPPSSRSPAAGRSPDASTSGDASAAAAAAPSDSRFPVFRLPILSCLHFPAMT